MAPNFEIPDPSESPTVRRFLHAFGSMSAWRRFFLAGSN